MNIDQRCYEYQPAEMELRSLRKQVSVIPELVAAITQALRDIDNPRDVLPRSRHTLSMATQQMMREVIAKLEGGAK